MSQDRTIKPQNKTQTERRNHKREIKIRLVWRKVLNSIKLLDGRTIKELRLKGLCLSEMLGQAGSGKRRSGNSRSVRHQ